MQENNEPLTWGFVTEGNAGYLDRKDLNSLQMCVRSQCMTNVNA